NLTGEAGPTPIEVKLVVLNDPEGRYKLRPARVTIPTGATSAAFQLIVPVESSGTTIEKTVQATRIGDTTQRVSGSVIITPVTLKGITLNKTTIVGGFFTKGTVTISEPAPSNGMPVYLFSSNPAVIVPAKITVAASATNGTFSVKTTQVLQNRNVVIAASRANVNPFTNTVDPSTYKTIGVTVVAHTIMGMSLVPNPVSGGELVTGTVTLSNLAPSVGVKVYLFSADTSLATVPTSITIPAGERVGRFTVTTKVIAGTASVAVTASLSPSKPATAVTKTVVLKINRGLKIAALEFEPNVVRGAEFTNLHITLNGPVPGTEPVTIKLVASNPDLVVMPSSVTVQPGQGPDIYVRVTANRVARDLTTDVTATLFGQSLTTTLKVIR
ncbi:MAG TPA: hypothetical protein VGE01_00025, partial [Fimbriimonas sp.]